MNILSRKIKISKNWHIQKKIRFHLQKIYFSKSYLIVNLLIVAVAKIEKRYQRYHTAS